jgi:hypothetical protein
LRSQQNGASRPRQIPDDAGTWLDGVGYRYGAVRGLMTVDALANGLGALVLLLIARAAGRYFRASAEPQAAIASL